MTQSVRWRMLAIIAIATLVGWYAAAQDTAQPRISEESQTQLEELRTKTQQVQQSLQKDGVLRCCIKPACVFCELATSTCGCAINLEKGKGVCPECFGGWYVGQGALDKKEITFEPNAEGGTARLMYKGNLLRIMPLSLLRTYYQQRALALGVNPAEADQDQPPDDGDPAADKPGENK